MKYEAEEIAVNMLIPVNSSFTAKYPQYPRYRDHSQRIFK